MIRTPSATWRALDRVRLAVGLLVVVVLTAGLALEVTDQEAAPVGVIFLVLVVVGRLAGFYRYADVGALLIGSGAYGVLEQGRGHTGVLAWGAATAGLAVTMGTARWLESRAAGTERRVRQTQGMVDELTLYDEASGLLKRRYGELAIEEEVRRARRTNTSLSLVLVAADPVPDHPLEELPDEEEEAVLVGALMRERLRVTDRMTRLSPTIFAAILPATPADGGRIVAEKLSASDDHRAGRPLRCGVATFPDHALSAQELLAEADAALRLARTAGLPVVNPTMLHSLATPG